MKMKYLNRDKEKKVYKVSELSAIVKANLEYTFFNLWVEGEISNKKEHPSGHVYFTVKDEKAAIKCIMFKTAYRSLKSGFKDGDKVLLKGRISFYEKRGELQLIVDDVINRGVGELQIRFELLKKKLEKEGLFREEIKKKIPFLPKKIGIVTSQRGAAIRDILRVLDRRHNRLHILIYGVKVQGEGAAEEIAEGIDYFNKNENVDVIIITRGGGSIEDLWAFNEEIVARAIYNSRIPVISAVGHEIDFTIADFVADLRASTPSVAAEIVVEKREIIEKTIDENLKKLKNHLTIKTKEFKEKLFELENKKVIREFKWRIENIKREVEDNFDALYYSIKERINGRRNSLMKLSRHLFSLHPLKIIENRKKKIEESQYRLSNNIVNLIKEKKNAIDNTRKSLNNLFKTKIDIYNSRWNLLFTRMQDLSYMKVLERGFSITLKQKNGKYEIIKDLEDIEINDKIKTILFKGEIISEILEIKEKRDEQR